MNLLAECDFFYLSLLLSAHAVDISDVYSSYWLCFYRLLWFVRKKWIFSLGKDIFIRAILREFIDLRFEIWHAGDMIFLSTCSPWNAFLLFLIALSFSSFFTSFFWLFSWRNERVLRKKNGTTTLSPCTCNSGAYLLVVKKEEDSTASKSSLLYCVGILTLAWFLSHWRIICFCSIQGTRYWKYP